MKQPFKSQGAHGAEGLLLLQQLIFRDTRGARTSLKKEEDDGSGDGVPVLREAQDELPEGAVVT